MPRGYLKDTDYQLSDIEAYIRRKMREEKVTQSMLGESIGLGQSGVSEMLNKKTFTVEQLLKILTYLKADAATVGRLMVKGV